jgi:glutaredoxin-like YruB-family protein
MTAKKVKVRVYSTPTCPWCFKAKDFLRDNHIEFEDIDVKEDHEAAQYMIEKSGQMGVPVIEIGDEMVIGFDEERIKALLKLK